MAADDGDSDNSLITALIARAPEYEFHQALRVLAWAAGDTVDDLRRAIKIRPRLALGYPEKDVVNVVPVDSDHWRVETSRLGLYGVATALPPWYTENLIGDYTERMPEPRAFLDMLHAHLYPLLHLAWRKNRFSQNELELENAGYSGILYALIGLGNGTVRGELPEPVDFLKYLGLLSLSSRPALGLETILKDFLQTTDLAIVPFCGGYSRIPEAQRCKLGQRTAILNGYAVLGTRVADPMLRFRIRIGSVTQEIFQRFLEDRAWVKRLRALIDYYLKESLKYEVVLNLSKSAARGAVLGGSVLRGQGERTRWARLGLDTWLLRTTNPEPIRVVWVHGIPQHVDPVW